MTTPQEMIHLKSDRVAKIRTGLYIDEPLFDQIKDIAERSEISVNETFILLMKQGINAIHQTPSK